MLYIYIPLSACSGVVCSDNETCIPSSDTCDGICDCDACDDEIGCYCYYRYFQCDNGQCIRSYKRNVYCDGNQDCYDGKDIIPNWQKFLELSN